MALKSYFTHVTSSSHPERKYCFAGFSPDQFDQLKDNLARISENGSFEPDFAGCFSVGDIMVDVTVPVYDPKEEDCLNSLHLNFYQFVSPEEFRDEHLDHPWKECDSLLRGSSEIYFGDGTGINADISSVISSMSYDDFRDSLVERMEKFLPYSAEATKLADHDSSFWDAQMFSKYKLSHSLDRIGFSDSDIFSYIPVNEKNFDSLKQLVDDKKFPVNLASAEIPGVSVSYFFAPKNFPVEKEVDEETALFRYSQFLNNDGIYDGDISVVSSSDIVDRLMVDYDYFREVMEHMLRSNLCRTLDAAVYLKQFTSEPTYKFENLRDLYKCFSRNINNPSIVGVQDGPWSFSLDAYNQGHIWNLSFDGKPFAYAKTGNAFYSVGKKYIDFCRYPNSKVSDIAFTSAFNQFADVLPNLRINPDNRINSRVSASDKLAVFQELIDKGLLKLKDIKKNYKSLDVSSLRDSSVSR